MENVAAVAVIGSDHLHDFFHDLAALSHRNPRGLRVGAVIPYQGQLLPPKGADGAAPALQLLVRLHTYCTGAHVACCQIVRTRVHPHLAPHGGEPLRLVSCARVPCACLVCVLEVLVGVCVSVFVCVCLGACCVCVPFGWVRVVCLRVGARL